MATAKHLPIDTDEKTNAIAVGRVPLLRTG